MNHQLRHVPALQPMKGKSYPPCREPSFRVPYIDDALVASTVRLDYEHVPLLPTDGPHGRLGSCGLGLPGGRLQLEHRLRDVGHNASAIGMKLNEDKTKLMVFNFTKNRQFIPFCSLTDGNPLPVVETMRLLGLIVDHKLTWWPLVHDLERKSRCKI